jgi:hypothetical protein
MKNSLNFVSTCLRVVDTRRYPLFDEVRKIVAKTVGAAPVIAQSLKKIED